jgi:hypothetical protein
MGKEKPIRPPQWKPITENILEYLGDLKNYPDEALAPYEEFKVGDKTYYFTTGGSLYRKDPGSEEGEGFFFCVHPTDEVWNPSTTENG